MIMIVVRVVRSTARARAESTHARTRAPLYMRRILFMYDGRPSGWRSDSSNKQINILVLNHLPLRLLSFIHCLVVDFDL